jgi:hypothetical protein
MTRTIIAGVGLLGGTTITDMGVVAGFLREQMGVEVRFIPELDPRRKLEWLKNECIDIFYESSPTPMYLEGNSPEDIGPYRGPFPMRIVGSAHFAAIALVVREDSEINSIYDITPETRWATPALVPNILLHGMLAWVRQYKSPIPENPARIEWTAKVIPCQDTQASLRAVIEGRADITIADAVEPWVRAASKIRFLDLPVASDPEGVGRFRRFVPIGKLKPAPRETAEGIWGNTCFLGTACLWCRPDFDTELAYELTRWFDVNYALYKDKGMKLLSYTRQAFREALDVATAPVHNGTVRYCRETGIWTKADDARQEYNTRLMDWYCAVWKEATAEAKARGIAISAASEPWIKLWAGRKKELHIPVYRQMNDGEIEQGLTLLKGLGR